MSRKRYQRAPFAKRSGGGRTGHDLDHSEPRDGAGSRDRAAAEAETSDTKDGFKRGGHKPRRKRGGSIAGRHPARRADKPRRSGGGRTAHPALSSAAEVTGRPGGHYDGVATDREDD